jgi:predicted RNase H-like HicB family nuclease
VRFVGFISFLPPPVYWSRDEFTAIIERDGKWHIGYCPEIPGANGQGETVEECKKNLADAIALILRAGEKMLSAGFPQTQFRLCSLAVS